MKVSEAFLLIALTACCVGTLASSPTVDLGSRRSIDCDGCETLLQYIDVTNSVLQERYPAYEAQLLQGTGRNLSGPSDSPDDFGFFTIEYNMINDAQHEFWVSFKAGNQKLTHGRPSIQPFLEDKPIHQPVNMTADEAYAILIDNGYSSDDGYTLYEATLRFPLTHPPILQTYWIFDLQNKLGITKYVGVGVQNGEIMIFTE